MSTGHIIVDRNGYEAIRTYADSMFDLSSRLPDMVFRRPADQTLFCEYEIVLGTDFWPALSHLASIHGDAEVQFLTLDPSPDAYYFREYGVYAAFSLDVGATPEEYWDALTEAPGGDSTGAVVFSADVIAVVGRSSNWGCWGERGLGVAVFQSGLESGIESWEKRYGPFTRARGALDHYVAPNFGTSGVPMEIASSLLANY